MAIVLFVGTTDFAVLPFPNARSVLRQWLFLLVGFGHGSRSSTKLFPHGFLTMALLVFWLSDPPCL